MVRGGVTYRILSDHLGSPRDIVDVASGAAVWRADYDAWGNRTVTLGTEDFVPFGFAGGIHDVDTRLVRFGARDYDAVTGRWTAKDPIGFLGGQSNVYVYARNNPINREDPGGRGPVCDKCRDDAKIAEWECWSWCNTIFPSSPKARKACRIFNCSPLDFQYQRACDQVCLTEDIGHWCRRQLP
jgi:RHS repeat-associated protein